MDIRQLKEKLNHHALEVAKMFFPLGKEVAQEWKIGSLDGEPGKSLGIHLSGPKAGIWFDFESSIGGDLIDLWQQKKGLTLAETLKDIHEYFGIEPEVFYKPSQKAFDKPHLEKYSEAKDPVFSWFFSRGISENIIEKYRILSTDKGTMMSFPYYRGEEILFIKNRLISQEEKRFYVEKNCRPILFGWQNIPDSARKVVIVEGEIDVLSLAVFDIPALSVPLGAGENSKNEWIEYELPYLDRFEEIYIMTDMDPVGRVAARDILNRLGRHRCRLVELPYKDANECLMQGFTKSDFQQVLEESIFIDPEELKSCGFYLSKVMETFYPVLEDLQGQHPLLSKLCDKISFRPAEMTIWTGFSGHGKSQALGQFGVLDVVKQGGKICIASPELPPPKLLHRLVRQATGRAVPTTELVEQTMKWLDPNLFIYHDRYTMKLEKILEIFEYAYKRFGANHFIVDSLMKCDVAEDDLEKQKNFVNDLCNFAQAYYVHVHLVAHVRKSENEFELSNKQAVSGSGHITNQPDNVVVVWRNRRKEITLKDIGFFTKKIPLEEVIDFDDGLNRRNSVKTMTVGELLEMQDALFSIEKQRHGTNYEGKFGLFWHQESFQFFDKPRALPRLYVPDESF